MNQPTSFRRNLLPNFRAMLLLGGALMASPVLAQDDHDDHDGHDHTGHDHKHHPAGHHGDTHAGHAHPGIELSHPIIVESPLPETKLKLNYGFGKGGEGTANVFEAEGEYAFTQNFSIEAVVPYVFVNPEEGSNENGLDNVVLAAKFASYRWVDQRFLPAIGLEVALPTGDDDKGIGSDHVVELEPFIRVGAWREKFEVIGTFAVGIPLNQTSEEKDEEDFEIAVGGSFLYHFTPRLQGLLEVTGEHVAGEEDETAFYLSPGVTFQPFTDPSISFGVGATLPITDDRDFDFAVNAMCIIHF